MSYQAYVEYRVKGGNIKLRSWHFNSPDEAELQRLLEDYKRTTPDYSVWLYQRNQAGCFTLRKIIEAIPDRPSC